MLDATVFSSRWQLGAGLKCRPYLFVELCCQVGPGWGKILRRPQREICIGRPASFGGFFQQVGIERRRQVLEQGEVPVGPHFPLSRQV